MNTFTGDDLDIDSSLVDLSPHQILQYLNENDKTITGNPYEIMKSINNFNSPKFSKDTNLNNDLIEVVGGYDYLTKEERQQTLQNDIPLNNLNIHEILDELINQESDINNIEFNIDQENIYEVEEPNLDKFEEYKMDIVNPKDIPERIKDPHKKIGSIKQKTINMEQLYATHQLFFKDEAEDLFILARNKLLIYWEIIIDFENVEVSDTFLKYSVGNLCKWLSPIEINQRITFANLEDEQYVTLLKTIIPNSFKYWVNQAGVLEQNIDLDKLDLYRTLTDEEISLSEFSPERLADKKIPFEFISASFLGNKREKKLKYPVYFVEKITGEVIENYKINEIVNTYISQIIDHKIDWEEVQINARQNDLNDNYKLQFGIEEYNLIFSFTQSILLDKCYLYLEEAKNDIVSIKNEIEHIKKDLPESFRNKLVNLQTIQMDIQKLKVTPDHIRFKLRRIEELEFALMDLEHKYFIKEDILKNIFEVISFSMYKTGLDKVKLIAFHFLANYLEQYSIDFWETIETKKIRGYITTIEIFRYELVGILQADDNLKKFIFTIRELILKWVFKYTHQTPIAKVYFDFMMITPELLTETILRYIALIAIKNKNPMTLRAVYSSYISLIHTTIYLTINSNVYDRKYGFFRALENLKDEKYEDSRYFINSNRMVYTNTIIRTYMLKNPILLNDNYFLLKRLNISPMLELNSLNLYASKPDTIPIHDWWQYYVRYFRHFESIENNGFKIKSKFIKSDKRNAQQNYISLITHEILREPLYNRIKDYTCVDTILDGICDDISMRTINRGYMDNNFKLKVKANTTYFDEIFKLLQDIKNKL